MQQRKTLPVNRNNAARDVRRGYPRDWPVRSWFVRVVRARNRCEWCGARNHAPHPVTGSHVVLTTAHVYDRAPGAAALLNLAALCQRCHLNHDRVQHLHSRRTNRDRATGQLSLFAVPPTGLAPQGAAPPPPGRAGSTTRSR